MKWWISICAVLFLAVSCASLEAQRELRSDPQYQQGYEVGKKTADDDRLTIDCYTPSGAQGLHMATERTEALREEGKSEAFLKGFYNAYLRQYNENIGAMCD